MPTDSLPIPRARQRRDGGHSLRVRAVLHEDAKARELEAQYTRRDGKPQTHTLLPQPELLSGRVRLTQHVARTGTLPSVTRSRSKNARRCTRAHAMHRHGGELVFMRLSLGSLDPLPLRASSTVACARELVTARLARLAPGAVAYDAALQRGEHGGTHAHILLPLMFLTPLLRSKAQRAPAGKGGGASFGADVHVARVDDTPQDRERVATYMGRDPDGRFDLDDPSNPAYLDALEDLLQHRASGDESQLTWGKLPRSWRS